MAAFEEVEENFKFLITKVRQQVEETLACLDQRIKYVPNQAKIREDYIDNLKIIIERKSYKKILKARTEENKIIRTMSSLNTVVSNLEEIGDYLTNIMTQMQYFNDPDFIGQFDYQAYFREILTAVDLIPQSFIAESIRDALIICRSEIELDRFYKRDFDVIMKILQDGRDIGDAITVLNILRYLERIGDSLLNIGEAVISAYAGTRLKIFEYIALNKTLSDSDGNFLLEDINVETRSGCRIEKVVTAAQEAKEVLFKEGDAGKLEAEKKKLEDWQKIMPGLTPRVFNFQNLGDKAILLLEYISGFNLQQILLNCDIDAARKAYAKLTGTLDVLWDKTKNGQPDSAKFVDQLLAKLPEVYRVHASLRSRASSIGKVKQPALRERLVRAQEIEAQLAPPFSVFIHGDFNLDNIMYNPQEDKIYFIDPHRSAFSDYVQDISVFLVSHFRIPVFDTEIRQKFNDAISYFYNYGKGFAENNSDGSFEARLAFGIIRSYITSTRFVVGEEFAKEMYFRGVYLLDKVLAHAGRSWNEFTIPIDVLMY